MVRNTLSELVDIRQERTIANNESKRKGEIDSNVWSNNDMKIYNDFFESVKRLNHDTAVNELIEYFKRKLSENNWNHKDDYWLVSIIEIADPVLIPYLTNILKLQGEDIPYYSIIDVLRWVPEEVGALAVTEFCEIISANNPYWNDDIFQAAFETLFWIGDEKGYEFIYRSCDSEVESISKWAKYYRDNWIEDPETDSE